MRCDLIEQLLDKGMVPAATPVEPVRSSSWDRVEVVLGVDARVSVPRPPAQGRGQSETLPAEHPGAACSEARGVPLAPSSAPRESRGRSRGRLAEPQC
jgi:hypothetical protein